MKKTQTFFMALLCLLFANVAYTQSDFNSLFKNAYQSNPKIPYPALEVLAYAQTRIANVQLEVDMDHHHGPNRFGIFGLIENGEGYFRNTLKEIAQEAKVNESTLKLNAATQIQAVAKKMNTWATHNNTNTVVGMKDFFTSFFEGPSHSKIDEFARQSFLYEIYLTLKNGFTAADVTVAPYAMDYKLWFTPENFKILSAPHVYIDDKENITDGKNKFSAVYTPKNNTINYAAAALNVDYATALWVASPNYSSRAGTAISAVAIHTMQGSYSGSISWFQNSSSNASAHYMVRSSDGQITQMVREVNKAWHAGTANPYTVGIEHEGYVNNAAWYTTAMYAASANLTIDICNRNNIDKTTCYSGAASSTVVVLSTAIKIKGHQHFSNQTHTDPGINWNWASYYNLINPPTCNATTTLNASYIGTNAANLNWSAVANVTNYTVQWKTTAATTWNSATSTNNYYTITGLTASTAYNWRIVSNCAVGTSTSGVQSLTTNASCYDAYENNNSYLAPTTYPQLNGGFVYAKVCASGDADFFKVTTTSTSNINIALTNLPKNYNVETFTTSGVYLQGAYQTGTTNEALTMNNKPAGSYLVKIYGATSTDHDALSDYRLKITTSAPTARTVDNNEMMVHLNPNPASYSTTLSFTNNIAEQITIIIKDIYGTEKQRITKYLSNGLQRVELPLQQFKEGIYFVQILNKIGLIQSKQLIIQR
jgi:N-acetyl-anhydromuramyl-L-alanine amidase AmpD